MSRGAPYLIFALLVVIFAGCVWFAKLVYADVPPNVARWLPAVERHIVTIWGADDWVALHGSLIEQESAGRPGVGSPAGAVGLLQIMPATFRELVQQHPGFGSDRRDPETSIALGARYLHRMHRMHRGAAQCERWRRALSSYNAGPGATARRLRRRGSDWLDHMPRETRRYVPKVIGRVPGYIRAGWPGRTPC